MQLFSTKLVPIKSLDHPLKSHFFIKDQGMNLLQMCILAKHKNSFQNFQQWSSDVTNINQIILASYTISKMIDNKTYSIS